MLVERISRISRETYAESLVGMGGVFPRRSREKGEIINDRSDDVTTFFRILQRHYVPYRAGSSRTEDFERLQASDPSALTDLERAARFLHLQRTAVGGEVGSRSLGVDPLGGRFNVTKLAPVLDALHNRLAGVIIERLPWTDFIARCDRTPFYLDPPCWAARPTTAWACSIRKTVAGLSIKPVSLTFTVARPTAPARRGN
jgi:DNA adenine methylase